MPEKPWTEKQRKTMMDQAKGSRLPDDEIACRMCKFRLPAVRIGGQTILQYKKSTCDKFQFRKPSEVLWEHANCPYFEAESGEQRAQRRE